MSKTITGFSKLSKEEKIDWLVTTFFEKSSSAVHILKQYWNTNQQLQQLHWGGQQTRDTAWNRSR